MYTWILVFTLTGHTPNVPNSQVIPGWQSKEECLAMADQLLKNVEPITYQRRAICLPQSKPQEQSIQRGSQTGKVGG